MNLAASLPSFLHPGQLESPWKKIVRPNPGWTRNQRGLGKQKWAVETEPSVRRLEIAPLRSLALRGVTSVLQT